MDFNLSYLEDCQEKFDSLVLRADRNKIVIVLRNLLSNALKFTSKCSIKKVDVKVSVITGRVVHVKSDFTTGSLHMPRNSDDNLGSNDNAVSIIPLTDMLQIEVIDTGPGISHVS